VPGQTHQRYALVSHVTGEVLGEFTWDAHSRRYVLTPAPGSTWNSTMLSEAALWVRKLSRQGMDVTMRMTGHLLLVLALAGGVGLALV
jgi:hypothetical protein